MEAKSQEVGFQDKKTSMLAELFITRLTISMDSIFYPFQVTDLLVLPQILILILSWPSLLQELSMTFLLFIFQLEFFHQKFAQIVQKDQLLMKNNVLALAHQGLIHLHIQIMESLAGHVQANLDIFFQTENAWREPSQLLLKLELQL